MHDRFSKIASQNVAEVETSAKGCTYTYTVLFLEIRCTTHALLKDVNQQVRYRDTKRRNSSSLPFGHRAVTVHFLLVAVLEYPVVGLVQQLYSFDAVGCPFNCYLIGLPQFFQ